MKNILEGIFGQNQSRKYNIFHNIFLIFLPNMKILLTFPRNMFLNFLPNAPITHGEQRTNFVLTWLKSDKKVLLYLPKDTTTILSYLLSMS